MDKQLVVTERHQTHAQKLKRRSIGIASLHAYCAHHEVLTCILNRVQLHSDLPKRKCCRINSLWLLFTLSWWLKTRIIPRVLSECETMSDRGRDNSRYVQTHKNHVSCIQKEMTQLLQIFFLLSSSSGFDTKKN